MPDITHQLRDQVSVAIENLKPLAIVGNNTKAFLGRKINAAPLCISEHSGIIRYEPTELVLTARAGTTLTEIEATLAQRRQRLAFEPPHYGDQATLGGTIASNLSGPARPFKGAARDFVLGVKMINGYGEILSFGGEVMKNVAGYDVSRLMCGAMGTLGVLLEISLKVLPMDDATVTLVSEKPMTEAIIFMNELCQLPLPMTASCYYQGKIYLRFSGSESTVQDLIQQIGGEPMVDGENFWQQIREQQHPFFSSPIPLWRISVAGDEKPIPLTGDWLLEWNGSLRWYRGTESASRVFATLSEMGGHASCYRGGDRTMERQQPLSRKLMELHIQTKRAFDPKGIFNPGRLYSFL